MMRNVNETETGGRWVRLSDGTEYRGDVARGAKEGLGKEYNMRQRTLYEGPFHFGKYHGVGGVLLKFPLSTPIDIELSPKEDPRFVKGEMHGSGRWVRLSDGTEYRGDVARGAKEGLGKEYNMRQRTLYEGPFHFGKYHGVGGVLLKFPLSTPIDIELSPKEVRDAAIRAEAIAQQQQQQHSGGAADEEPVVIIRGIPMVVEVPAALDASMNSNGLNVSNGVAGGGRSRGSVIAFPPGASSSTFPPGGGANGESMTSFPVGFLPPSIVTMALKRIKTAKSNELLASATGGGSKASPEKASPENSAARSRSPPNDSSVITGCDKMTIMHGPFLHGQLHGSGVTVRFANGDVFEGTAVKGELEGPSCEFLALCAGGSVPLHYRGPMKASRRSEIPTDIIVQDIYHDSTGSVVHQLNGDGSGIVGVVCTTSVLLVLQQVTKRTIKETVAIRTDLKRKQSVAAVSTAKMSSSMAASKRVEEVVVPTETVTRHVFDPCTGESGRPVRAQLYKLTAPLTEAQLKGMKRPPRDATKALFATEPLTPRADDSRNGSQNASQTASPRTPNTVGERATAKSPSDGRRTEEGDSLTPSSSKLGKTSKTQSSRSLASHSKSSPMMHFPLDSGKALLQMTMQDGSLTMKLAPLCREAGDYLAKIEVFHGGGFPTCPGGTGNDADDGMAPLPQNIFWIPLKVLR
ncbi:Hypothetical protein, putative [Bodo saltans]|uniref:MORN repeat-containing protein n=1 Tax=Bodo saltans TaxID=75058 RepID=A0A0S4II42_BODSA|nr:Hypothetical protein, putative [Bodo saltans]|eukprot:CUE70447.1 Hypothetical protein, putative [Bodo saltans]